MHSNDVETTVMKRQKGERGIFAQVLEKYTFAKVADRQMVDCADSGDPGKGR